MWHFRPLSNPARHRAHFILKQKSILRASPPQIHFSPLIAHHVQPFILRRASRAISWLEMGAVPVVQATRALHTPMRRLYVGNAIWLSTLLRSLAEFA